MSISKIIYILSIILFSTTFVSCLGEPEEIQTSSRNLITSCSFGSNITAYTSNMVRNDDGELVEVKDTTTYSSSDYTFVIDQLNSLIYTKDSLPVGSYIKKMPITLSSAGAYATRLVKDSKGNEVDTVWTSEDSLDLTLPVRFKVYASDLTTRIYTLKVNVHTVDPDSLVWNKFGDSFSGGKATGIQRSIVFNDQIITYAETADGIKAYFTNYKSAQPSSTERSLSGIENANIESVYVFNGNAYMTTSDKKIFRSADGENWEEVVSDTSIITIVGAMTMNSNSKKLILIGEEDGKRIFRTMDSNGWTEEKADVPSAFPADNFNGFENKLTTNSRYRFNVMGREDETTALNDTVSYSWFTTDGLKWTEMLGISTKVLPKMKNPTYLYYNGQTIAFGYGPEEKFNSIYSSEEYGLVWEETTSKIMLPYDFEGRENYSSVVTPDNYIWIFWSKNGTVHSDEVWKGRVNKLGFTVK